MVVEVTLNYGPQPRPDLGYRLMPAPPQLPFQLAELGRYSFRDGLARDGESAGLPGLSTDVGEPQEVKHFRLALAALLSVFGGMSPELNQARLVRVKFQPELVHAILSLRKEPLRVGTMFESTASSA
jgi:hypothetical protein